MGATQLRLLRWLWLVAQGRGWRGRQLRRTGWHVGAVAGPSEDERSPSSIAEFFLSLPGVRYRTDTNSAFGSADDRVVEDLDRMATGTE